MSQTGLDIGENQLSKEDYLSALYYNPDSVVSFSNENKLYKFLKSQGRNDISRFFLKLVEQTRCIHSS